jgi:hypothetical protein
MTRIKNKNGTADKQCRCGTWLKHWENFSNQRTEMCVVINCSNKKIDGAHVIKTESSDSNTYIVPLCKMHNQSIEILTISDSCKLVSANKSETCEK